MENGKGEMEDGRWKMEKGKGEMEDGGWKMEDGKGEMEDGRWKMEKGRWRMEDLRWKMEELVRLLTDGKGEMSACLAKARLAGREMEVSYLTFSLFT